jgi:hypothetical protein
MASVEESGLSDMADALARKLTTAVVIAAAIVGVAIYARPGPPRYDAVAVNGEVVRIDRRSGAMLACNAQRCVSLHKPGGRIERSATFKLPGADRPPQPQAVPQPPASAAPPKG